jgi:uncharacterized membrane protein (DUF4010 family)
MIGADLVPLELVGRLVLALGLAAFIGLAFEEVYKREERSAPGGVRTFPMLTLSGAMLYLIEPHQALAFVAGLIAVAIWLHASQRNAPPGPNTTTLMIPASNLVAYVLGPVALTEPPWLAVAVSVAAVLLLGTREQLHGLIRRIPQDELLTAGKFLILVGIILPLVPNQTITAATPLTPYNIWLAVVAVCTLSYLSYLLQKYAPVRNATLIPAILGGIYSSTATTVVLAKEQRALTIVRSELAAGIVIATVMMYLRLEVIIALFNLRFAWTLAPAMGALFAFGAALAVYEWRKSLGQKFDRNIQIPATNPLQIPTAMTFAAMFVVISVISAAIAAAFGQTGILILAALVGATDIDPFVINIAQGGVAHFSIPALSAAVLIATSSNNLAKAIYALAFGGVGCSRPALMLCFLAMLGFFVAAVYMLPPT